MRRLIPAPMMSAFLFVAWLLMNGSLSAGHVVLAAILGIAIPLLGAPLRGERASVSRPTVLLRLGGIVLWDIVMSNIEVARRILGPESRIRPAFVWVPLELRDPHGIAALAGIITLTPGTLSSDLSADGRHLLVHALNVDDPSALVASIKARYEVPLIEIFESGRR